MRCGKQGEDVAGLVGFDGAEASLGKAGGEPGGANLFTEGRGGNGDQLGLPVHDFSGIAVQPGEGGMDRLAGGDGGDSGKGRTGGERRHGDSFRVAAGLVEG